VTTVEASSKKIIYWHRELPPLNARALGDHCVEATSNRVSGKLIHRDELWDQCYSDLMTQAKKRLSEEISRLGGSCAHVLNESIDSRHDDVTGEAWLHGLFAYVLYSCPT